MFSDVFNQFQRFFSVTSVKDTKFLYTCALGFMPRRFDDTNEDRIIYKEEEEVKEIYFFSEGIIGVGFGLVVNGLNEKDQFIAKKMIGGPNNQCIIGDHYVVNNCKSQFIYRVQKVAAIGYALTKKFINDVVFPQFPLIRKRI